jgi:pilus assembly protein Flp/PilA
MIRRLRFVERDKGASAVEYGLIVFAIAAVVVVAAVSLGGVVRDLFTGTCQQIDSQTQDASATCGG